MNFMANSVTEQIFEEAEWITVGILFCYLKKSARLLIKCFFFISFHTKLSKVPEQELMGNHEVTGMKLWDELR